MQKQKISKLVFLILAIVLILALLLLIVGEKKDRTKNFYNKIIKANEYTFLIEGANSNNKNQCIISKSEEKRSLDVISDSEHTQTIVIDGYAYFIMHNAQEYYVLENSTETGEEKNIEADILENNLKEISEKKYKTGKEKVYGKTYYFEEFEDVNSFLMVNNALDEESKYSTKIYYEGNNIKYIKTTISGDEEFEELLKIECNYSADQKNFEVPSTYAER